MSCPTIDLAQTEEAQEPQYKKCQPATIDAPPILTETIDSGYTIRMDESQMVRADGLLDNNWSPGVQMVSPH